MTAGALHAIDAQGATVWSTVSETPSPLGAYGLSFPTIAPAVSDQRLPTLYVGSSEGKLYAVVVDSGLDPTSPWPKSHHDIRNTGNAAAPLP
jgi:outer membrane protein assembly factor BamB